MAELLRAIIVITAVGMASGGEIALTVQVSDVGGGIFLILKL